MATKTTVKKQYSKEELRKMYFSAYDENGRVLRKGHIINIPATGTDENGNPIAQIKIVPYPNKDEGRLSWKLVLGNTGKCSWINGSPKKLCTAVIRRPEEDKQFQEAEGETINL